LLGLRHATFAELYRVFSGARSCRAPSGWCHPDDVRATLMTRGSFGAVRLAAARLAAARPPEAVARSLDRTIDLMTQYNRKNINI